MLDMEKHYTHIHICRVICKAQAFIPIDDRKLIANTDTKVTGAMAIFVLKWTSTGALLWQDQ